MSTWRAAGIIALIAGFVFVPAGRARAAETILVDGSTGLMPLVAALAKSYEARNPGTTVTFGKGLGTKARLTALAEGKIDIAMASHGLVIEDVSRQGMAVLEFAKIAVVFGANDSVPVANLTDRQICDIYAGAVGNWKEVGGPDLAVAVRTRPETEVDTEVVRERIGCFRDLKLAESVRAMARAGDMAKELAATEGAIGMTTMTVVEQSNGKVRAVALNGVVPSAENVQGKRYRLTRDSFLVARQPPSPGVARFLAFVRSPAGAAVISANGAIPGN